jgi:dihydroflavonol-4-reductase
LKNGYAVRGSVRNLSKEEEVRKGIAKVIDAKNNLEFCELDLLTDKGWDKAMEGCEYVLHVASPFVIAEPKDENEIIKPAVEGTLRALKSAKKAGVKKVVLTSSTVAMAGDKKKNHLTQSSWTNPKTDKVSVYMKSKTLAESAAWDFYKSQPAENRMELTAVNPGPIYGPTLTGNLNGASMSMVRDIITGKVPMLPNTHYVMSDVRDIAKIHVAALENSQANGERFIVTSEKPYSFVGVASILKENGFEKASPRKAPSFMVKFMSLFNSEMKGMLPFVDAEVSADISSTKEVFNWKPIPFERTVVETAKSIQPLL